MKLLFYIYLSVFMYINDFEHRKEEFETKLLKKEELIFQVQILN
jgi:hypothetical protein